MLLIFICLYYWLTLPAHPIHISVSEVEITKSEINWTARIYTDDLLLGLYGKKADMSKLEDQDKVRSDILAYLVKNVSITLEGSVLQWSLVDVQPDPEAIWITITSATGSKKITSFHIRNDILLDIYRDQKNIVNITSDSGKMNIVFEAQKREKYVTF